MGAFDKYSNFNIDCNFIGVQFGERQPVLEVELNELQDIQNEARADIIRESIPSGFTKLSPFDYDYMASNPNTLKFKEESVAYVNGYKITIPKDTVVNVGDAPEGTLREDLVFLEVWKEAVDQTDTINKYGGEGQPTVPNHLKDSRYPTAMSQRVQIKWRIRHVVDVNFSKYTSDGFTVKDDPSVSGDAYNNIKVYAQGGNIDDIGFNIDTRYLSSIQRKYNTSANTNKIATQDIGLYVSGKLDGTSKTILKTLDGYSYAIPMFRLYRKPSSGKCSANAYQKAHPEVNALAFSNRVSGEKVEKAEEINVMGKTLQNLSSKEGVNATSPTPFASIRTSVYLLKNSTQYTFVIRNKTSNPYKFYTNEYCFASPLYFDLLPNETKVFNQTTLATYPSTSGAMFLLKNQSAQPTGVNVDIDVMLFEGNIPLEKIPKEYFEGIRSIGEANEPITLKTTGKNLISISDLSSTVLNNALIEGIQFKNNNNGSFSVEGTATAIVTVFFNNMIDKLKHGATYTLFSTGNIQMTTHDGKYEYGSTITCDKTKYKAIHPYYQIVKGATVNTTIYPQLEEGSTATTYEPYKESKKTFQLKEPLRSLPNGVCDEIVGNKVIRRVGKVILDGSETITSGLKTNSTIMFYFYDILSYPVAKNDTNLFCDNFSVFNSYGSEREGIYIAKDSSNRSLIAVNCNQSKLTTLDVPGFKAWLKSNPITIYYTLATPTEEMLEEASTYDFSLKRQFKQYFSGKETLRELPNGVKDTIENGKVIRRVGKIILNGSESWRLVSTGTNTVRFDTTISSLLNKVYGTTTLNLMCDKIKASNNNDTDDYEHIRDSMTVVGALVVHITTTKLATPDVSGLTTWLQANPVTIYYELATPEELSLDYTHYLYNAKSPLLQLPNGVKDEVVGNKVVRRCGKITLNGSETWVAYLDVNADNYCFNTYMPNNNKMQSGNIISNRFTYKGTAWNMNTSYTFSNHPSMNNLYIVLPKTSVDGHTPSAIKSWLQVNPTTVIYELATPYEEYITPDNSNYYPVTQNHNEYCGELYYQEGVNHTGAETIIEPEIISVNTFRRVLPKGKTEIVGCKSKKHPLGYENIEYGQGKNKFNTSILELGTLGSTDSTEQTTSDNRCRTSFMLVKPNTTYVFSMTTPYLGRVHYFNSSKVRLGSTTDTSFTTPSNCYYIRIVFMELIPVIASNNVQLEEGSVATTYETYIKRETTLPTLNENDVENLAHKVSLTGFDNERLLEENFNKFLKGEL